MPAPTPPPPPPPRPAGPSTPPPPPGPRADGLLDIAGLAAYLGVERTWVRDKVTARQLPHRRVGRHVRFAPEDVDAIVAGAFVPAATAPRRDEVAARRRRPVAGAA